MPCSAVTLSIATISAIIATALLAIAFSTDNWLHYEVKRNNIQTFAAKHSDAEILLSNLNNKYYYYTRTRGLFRICYPKERPPSSAVPTYLSPIETHCSNIDYFPQIVDNKSYNEDSSSRLHLARSCVAMFILSFITTFCAFWTGLSGCWKRSSGAITATSILLLSTCLLAAGAMGLWHTVEFFEKEKVVGEDFYQQWNTVLKDNTKISYDWSYIVAWAGVGCCLLSAILLSGAAVCLRSEREKEEQLNLQYLMPVYFDVDFWNKYPSCLVKFGLETNRFRLCAIFSVEEERKMTLKMAHRRNRFVKPNLIRDDENSFQKPL